jgi:DNA-directed RNA polymerase subunit RPC12/RpoP
MTTPDLPPRPATVHIECPWCAGRIAADMPLPESLRCDDCGTEVELAADPQLRVVRRRAA